MFLLDTNVVSAARKHDPIVARWIAHQARHSLWLSVVTIGEITSGIVRKERRDPAAAQHLSAWLTRLRHGYASRILDVDERIAEEWGRIDAIRTRSMADGLIAATAHVHQKVVVTRNVADFADTGVPVVNPWSV
ncbi:type II toxin-antitoxin system VapC family toxin [Aquibium sp. ELW1220]|uniref:type II toxin-antitoxin system VapC family toxin n=1 Tax=Aquibium sp. ELW1220 TaxID=2976766 RepID=UPI0025AFB3A8|nr:type II toxin-antitoxin system VapC family toxin [Aquibium sp. ELW1220]MDN2582575.1 type II toxin-antitoxin system VapC family toxin [Aquibium sp. ELW1220]